MDKRNKELISILDRMLPPSFVDGKNILVVDDEYSNLKSFKASFRREANIFIASNKKEAVQAVLKNKIDLIFCDYLMPEFNGAEVLKEIVSIYPDIKRCILTAYTKSSILNELKEKANTEDILYKPYLREDILMRIWD